MKFAYADPPYIGQAKKHYSSDEKCAEVNHRVLIATLSKEYEAWALSMSATLYSMQEIIPLLPEECRIAAWVKPFASFKPGVNPGYTWEPVIFYSPRKRNRQELTIKDHLIEGITMKRGLAGVKPKRFCYWLFDLVGLKPDDEFIDIFPGSGAVTEAHKRWKRAQECKGEQNELKLIAT